MYDSDAKIIIWLISVIVIMMCKPTHPAWLCFFILMPHWFLTYVSLINLLLKLDLLH